MNKLLDRLMTLLFIHSFDLPTCGGCYGYGVMKPEKPFMFKEQPIQCGRQAEPRERGVLAQAHKASPDALLVNQMGCKVEAVAKMSGELVRLLGGQDRGKPVPSQESCMRRSGSERGSRPQGQG